MQPGSSSRLNCQGRGQRERFRYTLGDVRRFDYVMVPSMATTPYSTPSGAPGWTPAGDQDGLTQGIQARCWLHIRRGCLFEEPNDEDSRCSPLLCPCHSLPRPKHHPQLSPARQGCTSRREFDSSARATRMSFFCLSCPCQLHICTRTPLPTHLRSP